MMLFIYNYLFSRIQEDFQQTNNVQLHFRTYAIFAEGDINREAVKLPTARGFAIFRHNDHKARPTSSCILSVVNIPTARFTFVHNSENVQKWIKQIRHETKLPFGSHRWSYAYVLYSIVYDENSFVLSMVQNQVEIENEKQNLLEIQEQKRRENEEKQQQRRRDKMLKKNNKEINI